MYRIRPFEAYRVSTEDKNEGCVQTDLAELYNLVVPRLDNKRPPGFVRYNLDILV